jgi:hypothetical protein
VIFPESARHNGTKVRKRVTQKQPIIRTLFTNSPLIKIPEA